MKLNSLKALGPTVGGIISMVVLWRIVFLLTNNEFSSTLFGIVANFVSGSIFALLQNKPDAPGPVPSPEQSHVLSPVWTLISSCGVVLASWYFTVICYSYIVERADILFAQHLLTAQGFNLLGIDLTGLVVVGVFFPTLVFLSGFLGLVVQRKVFYFFLASNILIVFIYAFANFFRESAGGMPQIVTMLQVLKLLPQQQSYSLAQKAILDLLAFCLITGLPVLFACVMTLSARGAQWFIVEQTPFQFARKKWAAAVHIMTGVFQFIRTKLTQWSSVRSLHHVSCFQPACESKFVAG